MSHEVRVKIDTAVVSSKDLEIIVRTQEGKLGKLLVSKGNIEWLPKGNSVNKKRFTWKQFADFMESHAKTVKAK